MRNTFTALSKKCLMQFFVIFCLITTLFIVLGVNNATVALGDPTYNLSIRCDATDTPNTYNICKVTSYDGTLIDDDFNWVEYKTHYSIPGDWTDKQVMTDLRSKLQGNPSQDVGYIARLVNPSPSTPYTTITSDPIDPQPVSLPGGSYILVSDTACPLLVGFDEDSDKNTVLNEKTQGPTQILKVKSANGEYYPEVVLSQDMIVELEDQINLPYTYEQFDKYPIIIEYNYDPELLIQDGPTVVLKDGADITDKANINIENGKIVITFIDLETTPELKTDRGFNINCKFRTTENVKPGIDGPVISGTITYPSSPTKANATKTTNPSVAKVALMKLAIFVCNKDNGNPYPGIDFLISNLDYQYLNFGENLWGPENNAKVFTTDANGYIYLDRPIGAGTYILEQQNEASDGCIPASWETSVDLGGRFDTGVLTIEASVIGAGEIMSISNETGEVTVKVELSSNDIWGNIAKTLDTNILIIIAVIVLLACSCAIYIQRKKVNRKRG